MTMFGGTQIEQWRDGPSRSVIVKVTIPDLALRSMSARQHADFADAARSLRWAFLSDGELVEELLGDVLAGLPEDDEAEEAR